MSADEGEDKALQVLHRDISMSVNALQVTIHARHSHVQRRVSYLHKVVEDSKTFGIFALLHLHEGAQLCSAERDMCIPQYNLKLLPAYSVRCRPLIVIFFEDLH